MIKDFLHQFSQFLSQSPTTWHAARQVLDLCIEKDFIPLFEGEPWDLKLGESYVVVREDAAVCAFRLPPSPPQRILALASHLDSPALKLKPNPQFTSKGDFSQFATEVYGSPLLHTWLDRELALTGKVVVKTSNQLSTHLVFLDDYPFLIPQLPIHLNRSIKERGLLINPQSDLNPLVSQSANTSLESLLRNHLDFEELVCFDLFLVPIQPPSFLGIQNEWMCGYRLDNLTSVFSSLQALLEAKPTSSLHVGIFWDHEEVGSCSRLGAESSFLDQILERIICGSTHNREKFFQLKSRSLCVSVDLAHGYHPSYPDRFDPYNTPYLGKGVVLKSNAQQRYATSSLSSAPLIDIGRHHKIPLQHFAMRSDIPCGTTVGSLIAATTGMPTVDLGIASWSMHSARETIATEDLFSLYHLLLLFLQEDCPL